MYKKINKACVLCATFILLLASITVYAIQTEKTITVTMGDIKIALDGHQRVLMDADGNEVEPMLYNGTTYAPVRAMSEWFGKSVEWDEDTHTVIISNDTISQDDVISAKNVIIKFFDHFNKQEYYEMKLNSTGNTSIFDFRDSVFGMREAKLVSCDIDEESLKENVLAFICEFDMKPTENSVYSSDETSATFYIIIDKINGNFLISNFVTGI